MLCWWSEEHKRNKRRKAVKNAVSIYMGINGYMFFDDDFLMHSFRKSLSETCITLLCNYYCFWPKASNGCGFKKLNFLNFQPVFMQLFGAFIFIYELLMGQKYVFAVLFRKRSKRGPNSEIFHIWKVYRIFIFYPIFMCFFAVQWIVWRAFDGTSADIF